MKVGTQSRRDFLRMAKGPEWTKRNRSDCGFIREYEVVTQHDLEAVGNFVFWRGARITPAFSSKQKDAVEDVRKTISV